MASLIKNQILKHLSKFAKNLSSDKINLSTFKGEGELNNLVLNEAVLMDLLELPTWLRLTKAVCNKVTIKIQWTKLKSVPLYVSLDELLIEIETCEKLRQVPPHGIRPSYSSGGKYGFSDQVIDGMTVTVNSVEVKLTSPAFHASFQISRLRLESRTPNWHRSTNLRMTRLKDPERGQLLIFKELDWQTLRIEAAASDPGSAFTSPLRLITNQTRCRITIKKRISDCGILASRLVLLCDDLLWVLTDTQIQAALHFLNSVSWLMKEAAEVEKKVKAAQKLEFQNQIPMQAVQQGSAGATPGSRLPPQNAVAKVFTMYDIVETSFHIYSSRIDLHFCDDAKPGEDGRSAHPQLLDGAAMQVILTRLCIDYYPYHFAFGDRKHWLRYNETNTSRTAWTDLLMAVYRQQLIDLVHGEAPRQRSPSHSSQPTSPQPQEERRRSSGQTRAAQVSTFLKHLMASCLVLRLDDFAAHQVSTAATKKKVPDRFISSDKSRLMLPPSMPAVHAEFTEFYFPVDNDFPVPVPNIHIHANPVQVTVEMITILWLNAFLLNLQKSQVLHAVLTRPNVLTPVDIRVEALMPRVIIPAFKDVTGQPDRPRSMQIQISRLMATNCRVGDDCNLNHLQDTLDAFQFGSLFLDQKFPSKPEDINPLNESFFLHALGEDNTDLTAFQHDGLKIPKERAGSEDSISSLRKDLLWVENKNVWCIRMEPVWVDFCGMESCRNRPSPFIDAVQATFWIVQDIWPPCVGQHKSSSYSQVVDTVATTPRVADNENQAIHVHVLAQFQSLVSIQLNHFQYLFLLRASEMLTEVVERVKVDAARIRSGIGGSAEVSLAVILPQVDISMVVPVRMAGGSDDPTETESLGGDLSSSGATTSVSDPNMIQAASGACSLKESLSDGHLSSPKERLTASSSDYVVNVDSSHTTKKVDTIEFPPPLCNGGVTQNVDIAVESSVESEKEPSIRTSEDSSQVRNGVGPPADDTSSISSESFIGGATSSRPRAPLSNMAMPQRIAGFFAQQGHSRSMDVFSVPLLEKATLDKVPDQLGKTIASGSSAVKKGFSSLVASFDSALLNPRSMSSLTPTSPQDIGSDGHYPSQTSQGYASSVDSGLFIGDDVDTMSMCSDLSDSDQFVLMNPEGTFLDDNLLSTSAPDPSVIEVASEVREDSSSEQSVASSFKRQDLMQVVSFRFGIVELVQLSSGYNFIVKIRAQYLQCEELGTMTWEEFQAKFSAGARAWQEEAIKYTLPTCNFRLRFQKGHEVASIYAEAEDRGFLDCLLTDASMNLSMSTVTNLADLVEDEIIPVAIPMKLNINNVRLHLQEDRPSSNVTSPGPIPIIVNFSDLQVLRTPDGVFQVVPGVAAESKSVLGLETKVSSTLETGTQTDWNLDPSCRRRRSSQEDLDERLDILEEENDKLRLKVINLEASLIDAERLKRRVEKDEENDDHVRQLQEAREELAFLVEEKKSLQATLHLLQEELLASEQRARKS